MEIEAWNKITFSQVHVNSIHYIVGRKENWSISRLWLWKSEYITVTLDKELFQTQGHLQFSKPHLPGASIWSPALLWSRSNHSDPSPCVASALASCSSSWDARWAAHVTSPGNSCPRESPRAPASGAQHKRFSNPRLPAAVWANPWQTSLYSHQSPFPKLWLA